MKTITIENFTKISLEKRKLVLAWRNSDRVRLMMTNQEIISLEDHLHFIDSLSRREDKKYYLLSIDNEPFGVQDFVNCNQAQKSCETGLYIGNEKFLGLGWLMYYYNFEIPFNHFGFDTITSSVLKSNHGAFSICTRLFGLEVIGETEKEYFVRYTKDRWNAMSNTFKEKILATAEVGTTVWKE